MSAWKLMWRSFRHSTGSYVRMGFVAASLGLLALLINGFGTTVERTVSRDLAARSFDRAAAVALGDPSVGQYSDLIERTEAVLVVRQQQDFLSTLGIATDVDVVGIVAGQPAAPNWVEGRYPQRVGEVSLSSTAAEQLNVGVGGVVSTDGDGTQSAELAVVGVFPTLGDRSGQAAVLAVPSSDQLPTVLVDPDAAQAWIDVDPSANAPVNWAELSEFTSRPLEIAGTLRSVERVISLAIAGAVAFATLAFARGRSHDVEALQAAGMNDGVAKRLFMWSSVLTNLVGLALGSVLGFGALSLARGAAGALVGQTWVAVDVSPVRIVFYVVFVALSTITVWATDLWSPARLSRTRAITIPPAATIAGAVALAAALAVVWGNPRLFDGQQSGRLRIGFLLLAGILLSTVVPRAVELATQPSGRGLRALVRAQGVSGSITLASSLFVSLGFLLASAVDFGDYETTTQASSVPPRGLILEAVRSSDARMIADRYETETGTDALILELFPERGSDARYRVMAASAQECLAQTRSVAECMEGDAPQIGVPAIAATGIQQTDEWQVSPILLNGADEVVFVEFNGQDGSVINTTVMPAKADTGTFTSPDLVGSEVSALAPAGTDVGAAPTHADVYLPGFANLDNAAQGRVQRANFDIAPYSIVHLAFKPDYALLARAWSTAILGLVIAGVLLFRWNDGVWLANPTVVAAFESQGGAGTARRRLVVGSIITQAASIGIVLLAVGPLARNVLHAYSSQFTIAVWAYMAVSMAVLSIGAFVQNKQLKGGRS